MIWLLLALSCGSLTLRAAWDPPLDVLTARATALARLGRSREAVAAFERARGADPGNPAILVQLATVHIAAGENEAAGVEQMKFFEVAPNLNMTQHAITIRPLCFSTKTLNKLPPDLQAAILKAGKEAGTYGRQIESSEDTAKLDAMEKAGKLKRIPFADRAAMKKAVDPIMTEYAKEIGAEQLLAKINAIK